MKKIIITLIVILGLGSGLFLLINTSSDNSSSNSTISTSTSTKQSSTTSTYTPQQVAEHASENDCWLIIDGSVYDVTKYINKHPGGAQEIVSMCGQDATNAFKTQGGRNGHPNKAYNMLANLKIGTLQ